MSKIINKRFNEIPVIDGEECKAILQKMQRDEAEPMEHLAYRKFKVCSALKEETADEWEAVWNEYMENIHTEQYFWNMVREKHSKTAQTASKEAEVRFLTMTAKHLEQRTTLDKILKLCGMTHTQEVKTIKGEDFAKMVTEGAKLEAEVRTVFGIRKSERKDGAFDVKALHDMLTSVWFSWSGVSISTINERRITIAGKRVRVYDYKFHPRTLWEKIKDICEVISEDEKKIVDITIIEQKKRRLPPIKIRNNVWKKAFGENTEGICVCCKERIHITSWDCSHIIAFKLGGLDSEDNLLPACKSCNRSMGIENLFDFKQRCYPDL